MKNLTTLSLFATLFLSTAANARVGLAEIFFETPGGHTICHCDPYPDAQTPILIGFDKLERLEKWYFYRDHIIGKGTGYYFVFDEKSEEYKTFKNESDWKKVIEDQNLEPIVTRWFDLSDSPQDWFFLLVITAVFTVPIIIAILIVIGILFLRKKILWARRLLFFTAAVLLIFSLFTLRVTFLESF
ncbi:MAG: hypothetical protein EOO50_02110 [Flavobacterium sp.]|uniref:hypothetical protein n=1 Tax=Flavobacterium sp. TaxID=239 RepID=UPI001224F74C|nr:hypothetical protein [Flavobacterium sp.]RZJ68235.1 MAG: hypothetical protein EOO50_02110 [Flavobacterium sp.]